MNQFEEPRLETPLTYLLPMREDKPDFANLIALKLEITDIMGPDYPTNLVSRLTQIIGSGQGLEHTNSQIAVHRNRQPNGLPAGVRAVIFKEVPLTADQIYYAPRRGIGRVETIAAQAIVAFACRLQKYCELPVLTDD